MIEHIPVSSLSKRLGRLKKQKKAKASLRFKNLKDAFAFTRKLYVGNPGKVNIFFPFFPRL